MCLPAAAAVVPMVIGGGLQAFGAMQAGNAKAGAFRTQAAEDRTRAEFIQRQNILEQTSSQYEQRKMHERADQMMGAQNAMYAQAGVLPDGSVMDVQADLAREASMDQQVAAWNATVQSQNRNFETGQAYRSAASNERAAKTAKAAGTINAMSSAFNTMSSLLSPDKAGNSAATALGLKW